MIQRYSLRRPTRLTAFMSLPHMFLCLIDFREETSSLTLLAVRSPMLSI